MQRYGMLLGLVALWLVVFSGATLAAEKPLKVFILAGQSNMEGLGGIKTLDALGAHPTYGQLLKKIKKEDGSFVERDDVFISYRRGNEAIKAPLTVGQGAGMDRIGPELILGIGMGDYYEEPVLLIKTAWGGKDLYCDFRPPSAGKPAYEIPGKPRELGSSYRKMIEEVHQCLDHLDTDFPKFKGRPYELCGFVWFQGWNDMCAAKEIKQQVLDEYAQNSVHLVQDLRAELRGCFRRGGCAPDKQGAAVCKALLLQEIRLWHTGASLCGSAASRRRRPLLKHPLRVPNLPVVTGEVGVDGDEHGSPNMVGLRAAQAKIKTYGELSSTLRYVRTAPFWYPELDELPYKLAVEERRVRLMVTPQVKEAVKDKPEASDPKKLEQLVNAAVNKALATGEAYQKVKAEHDQHISHWICHYQGSARVYALVGYSFAEAMKELLQKK